MSDIVFCSDVFRTVLGNMLNTAFLCFRTGRAGRFRPARSEWKHCKGEIRMNGNLKRFTAALLSLIFLLALLPSGVSAADTVASGMCGTNLSWTLDSDGVLTLSGVGAMTDFSSVMLTPWHDWHQEISSVIVPEGVESIGNYAFCYCTELTSLTISESILSIGEYAFYGCSGLTGVTIPSSVTNIGSSAFYNCTNLANITFSGDITSIGSGAFAYTAFYNNGNNWENGALYCGKYLLRVLPELNSTHTIKAGTTVIADYAFAQSSLTSLTVPTSVTSIGRHAFNSCSSLTDVYYGGTQVQWNAISIGSNNGSLLNATIHYAQSELAITSQPTDFNGQLGDAVSFTIEATGEGLTYQWQYSSDDGVTWKASSLPGNMSATLSTTLTDARLVYRFRCVVTDSRGTNLISDVVRMFKSALPPDDPTQFYTVSFFDSDGTVLKTAQVPEGGFVEPPTAPEKTGVSFLGWSGQYTGVTNDSDVSAVYSDAKNVFAISTAKGNIGETVTVLLSLEGSVKTCGFDLNIKFDEALQLVSYDDDLDMDIIANTNAYSNGIKLNYIGTRDTTRPRDIISLTFRIRETSKLAFPIWLEMNSIYELLNNDPAFAEFVLIDTAVRLG